MIKQRQTALIRHTSLPRLSLETRNHSCLALKILKSLSFLIYIISVCESGDTFASARPMPRLKAGDLVAFLECGAASMASEYNARPRVSEIMIKQRQTALIRHTSSHDALLKQEIIPAWL